MKCPKCQNAALITVSENTQYSCPECKGSWVTGDGVGKLDRTAATLVAGEVKEKESKDSKTGLCPAGHGLMVRTRIDVENPFYLEKCTACGGIWFDFGEWHRIVSHRLVDNLAELWTRSWQRKQRREKNHETLMTLYTNLLGTDIVDQILALSKQIKNHPEKERAIALLRQEIE